MASAQFTEEYKRRLVSHLMTRVTDALAGRDRAEIVDLDPRRAIYAGVLQPPHIAAASSGGQPPAGSALGLEFRVRPDSSSGTVRLRITPRWSHYYAVFPSYEQALAANQALAVARATKSASEPDREEIESAPGGAEIEDTASTGDGLHEENDLEESRTVAAGRTILPRVFHRHEVRCEPIVIEIPGHQDYAGTLGEAYLTSVLAQATARIASDEQQWRHLANPEAKSRELGDSSVLENTAAYAAALRGVAGEQVDLPPWAVALEVRSTPDATAPDLLRIRVLFANVTPDPEQQVPDAKLEERAIFDAGLAVDIDGGILIPFEFLLAPKDYRSNPQMAARGINCTPIWDSAEPRRVITETLPVFAQPYYRTQDGQEVEFTRLDVGDVTPLLDSVAADMALYWQAWDAFLTAEATVRFTDAEHAACQADRDAFSAEIEQFRLGIETLRQDRALAVAFRLMNQVFARLGARPGSRLRGWRLFQLGFIISHLPSLAARELPKDRDDPYARALREHFDEVGILWFPTGGGKTEAYLGLIATTLLYDRLRGKTRGVSAWMRFPLRMLSLQQLDRLAHVVAELNKLRTEVPSIKGGDPFAIGYYIGQRGTPNSISEELMARYERDSALRERAKIIRKCPFCGNVVNIEPRRTDWRLAHVCVNPQCFSNTSSSLGRYVKSLPICVVDREIYRYLPSVLVGTVDKLAIIGHSRGFAHIVRGVRQECPVHGYTSYDECLERRVGCALRRSKLSRLDPLKDSGPALLLQDEMHLLRAELGVFNGHYEGLLRYLGGRSYLPPKVLAATATIEAYDVQAFHIYLSRARRYPQPAWRQGESFYATSTPRQYRRHYVGVLCHTRAIEDLALRLLTAYRAEIQRLQSSPRLVADLLQEPTLDDEVIRSALRLYDLTLAYVNRKATGGSLLEQIERRTSGATGSQSTLLTGDQGIDEVGEVIERVERERDNTPGPRLETVIATSLISHGVDLERINMMVVCGMPSHYAEYVQTTSRAARAHPGLVFSCFLARDPREISQYEFFLALHEHLDRLIEAVPVNRFATFAPHKTVPGLLAGLLLSGYSPELFGTQISRPLDYIPTLQVALGLKPATTSGGKCIEIDELRRALEEIIGVDKVHALASPSQVENVRRRIREVLDEKIGEIGRTLETQLSTTLHPLLSFRDIDEGLDFGSVDAASLVTRLQG